MARSSYVFWGVFGVAAAVRVAMSFGYAAPDASACLKHADTGVGIVAEDPERKDSGQVFVVDAEKIYAEGELCAEDISVRVKTKLYPRFLYGDRISFSGKLSKPMNFSSDNGRTFDYQGFLAKDDVFYEIKSAVATLASSTSGFSLQSGLFSLKRRFVANLERALGEPHAALAAGLVVGEKSALGKDLLDDFRTVGLIHIVVLSGFNITIVGVALRKMLSRLPRVWGITIGGIGVVLFGVLVGGGATVVRSCFMAGIALAADLIRRDYSVHRALIFAALVMLIQNPLILLHDPSFQLSFLATAGLLLLASPLEERLSWIPDVFGMRGTIATCLATQIFVSPFILWMMGQISIIGVVVNIIVLPFIPATMLLVFLAGALGFVWSPLSLAAGWGAHLLLQYELFTVRHFADIPYAALQIPPFSGWLVAAFYAAFFVCYAFRNKIARFLGGRQSSEDTDLMQKLS